MSQDEARRAWVKRVLGVEPATTPPATSLTRLTQALRRCDDVRRATRKTVQQLQAAFLGTADPTGRAIARGPLPERVEQHLDRMGQALHQLGDPARPALAKAPAAAQALAAAQAAIRNDALLTALERNPFGVPVAIRGTLLGAIAAVTRALDAAAEPKG